MEFASPRAWAFTLIGIQYYLRRFPGDRAVLGMQNGLVQKLLYLYQENGTDDWPWCEDIITHCNPFLPQALPRYGRQMMTSLRSRSGWSR